MSSELLCLHCVATALCISVWDRTIHSIVWFCFIARHEKRDFEASYCCYQYLKFDTSCELSLRYFIASPNDFAGQPVLVPVIDP